MAPTSTSLSRKIAASPLALLAAFPLRAITVARHDTHVLKQSASWLLHSRELSSFTYDLEPLNLEHLAWFIATVTGIPVKEARGYLREVEEDTDLRRTLREGMVQSPRRRTCDHEVRYGRRVLHYALVRALSPRHVVETGPYRGLSSCLIAAALLRNGHGRLTTIDIDPTAGELIRGPYADVVDLVIGDSARALAAPEVQERGIDLLAMETHFTPEHERAELAAAAPALTDRAVIVSTRSHTSPVLASWSEERHRGFLHFRDMPHHHWYVSGGLGVSFPANPVAREPHLVDVVNP
ncbi:class I SAM-dependent methyltransferase [Streptomyces sp. NPDC002671]